MNYEEIEKDLSKLSLVDILHQIPTGILIAEAPSGRLLMKNKVAEEILGFPLPYVESIHDYGRYYKGFKKEGKPYESNDFPLSRSIMYGEIIKDEEMNFTRSDGELIRLKVNSAPIYDSHWKVIAAIVTFSDVTAQIRAERLVKESLQKYQNLLDTVDGIVWEADASFCFTFVSNKAERLTGFTKEEWMQPNFWVKHIYSEDRDNAVSFCKDQVSKFLPHDFEYRLLTKDNRVIWLRDIVTVVTTDGFFTGLRGIMVDVTANKHIEELLQRSEERLKTILDTEPECVQLMDLEGIILEINPAGLAMYEARNPNDLIGKSIYPLISGPYHKVFQDLIKRVGRGEKGKVEYEIVGLQGALRWQEAHVVPLNHRETNNTHILAVVLDTTEKKQKEKQREHLFALERIARKDAEKSIQMRDDFLSLATHELKTPLTPIRIQVQLVKRYLETITAKIPNLGLMINYLDEADKKFGGFLKLVDNLLDVSRISVDRLVISKEEVNLTTLIEHIASSYLPEIKSNDCTLTLDLEQNVIGNWDKIRIEQVIVNLLSNAEKYGKGGPITISLKKKVDSLNVPKAIISVQDQGIGISKEDQARLFKKFERVASIKNFGGLGVGLFIAKSIVDAHHGTISIESTPGKGATFIVELPID